MAKKADYFSQLMAYNDKFHGYMADIQEKAQVSEDEVVLPVALITGIIEDSMAAAAIMGKVVAEVPQLKSYLDQFAVWYKFPKSITETESYQEPSSQTVTVTKWQWEYLTAMVLNQMANLIHNVAVNSATATHKLKACDIVSFNPDDAIAINKYCSGAKEGQTKVQKTDLLTFKAAGQTWVQSYPSRITQKLGIHYVMPSFYTEDGIIKSAIEYHDSDSHYEPGSTYRITGVKERLELLGFKCAVGKTATMKLGSGGSHTIFCKSDGLEADHVRELATYLSLLLDGDIAGIGTKTTPVVRDKVWELAQALNQKYGDNTWEHVPHKPDWSKLANEWSEESQYKKNPLYNELRELLKLRDKHHMIEEKYGIPNGNASMAAQKELLEVWVRVQKLLTKLGWGDVSNGINHIKSLIQNGVAKDISGMSDGVGHNLHSILIHRLAAAGNYGNCKTKGGSMSNINMGNLAYCEGVLSGTTAAAPNENTWLHSVDPNTFKVYQGEEDFPAYQYTFKVDLSDKPQAWQDGLKAYLKTWGMKCGTTGICKIATDDYDYIRQTALFLSNLRGASEAVGEECAKKAIEDAAKAAAEQNNKSVFAFTQEPIMSSKKAWIDKCWKEHEISPPDMTPEEKMILKTIGPSKIYGGCSFEMSDLLPDIGVIKYCEAVRKNPQGTQNAFLAGDGSLAHFYHKTTDQIATLNISGKADAYKVVIKNLNMNGQKHIPSSPMQKAVRARLKEKWNFLCPSETNCETQVPLSDDEISRLAYYLSSFHHAYNVPESCVPAAELFAFNGSLMKPPGLKAHQDIVKIFEKQQWVENICPKGAVTPPSTQETVINKPPETGLKKVSHEHIAKLAQPQEGNIKPYNLGGCLSYIKKLTLPKAAYCAGVKQHDISPITGQTVESFGAEINSKEGYQKMGSNVEPIVFTSTGNMITLTVPELLMHPSIVKFLITIDFTQANNNFTAKYSEGHKLHIVRAAILFSNLMNFDQIPDDCKEKAIKAAIAKATLTYYDQPVEYWEETGWEKFCSGIVTLKPVPESVVPGKKTAATFAQMKNIILGYFQANQGKALNETQVKLEVQAINPNVVYPSLWHMALTDLVNFGDLLFNSDGGMYSLKASGTPIKPHPATMKVLKDFIMAIMTPGPGGTSGTSSAWISSVVKGSFVIDDNTILDAIFALVEEGALIQTDEGKYKPAKQAGTAPSSEELQAFILSKMNYPGHTGFSWLSTQVNKKWPGIITDSTIHEALGLLVKGGKLDLTGVANMYKVVKPEHIKPELNVEQIKKAILDLLSKDKIIGIEVIDDVLSQGFEYVKPDLNLAIKQLFESDQILMDTTGGKVGYYLPEAAAPEVSDLDKLINEQLANVNATYNQIKTADLEKSKSTNEYKKLPASVKNWIHALMNEWILFAVKNKTTYDQLVQHAQDSIIKEGEQIPITPLMVKLQLDIEIKSKKNKKEIPDDAFCTPTECIVPAKKFEDMTPTEQQTVKDEAQALSKDHIPMAVLEEIQEKYGITYSTGLANLMNAIQNETSAGIIDQVKAGILNTLATHQGTQYYFKDLEQWAVAKFGASNTEVVAALTGLVAEGKVVETEPLQYSDNGSLYSLAKPKATQYEKMETSQQKAIEEAAMAAFKKDPTAGIGTTGNKLANQFGIEVTSAFMDMIAAAAIPDNYTEAGSGVSDEVIIAFLSQNESLYYSPSELQENLNSKDTVSIANQLEKLAAEKKIQVKTTGTEVLYGIATKKKPKKKKAPAAKADPVLKESLLEYLADSPDQMKSIDEMVKNMVATDAIKMNPDITADYKLALDELVQEGKLTWSIFEGKYQYNGPAATPESSDLSEVQKKALDFIKTYPGVSSIDKILKGLKLPKSDKPLLILAMNDLIKKGLLAGYESGYFVPNNKTKPEKPNFGGKYYVDLTEEEKEVIHDRISELVENDFDDVAMIKGKLAAEYFVGLDDALTDQIQNAIDTYKAENYEPEDGPWIWQEAFQKFGFGDGDNVQHNEDVGAVLEQFGWTPSYVSSLHNGFIYQITKDDQKIEFDGYDEDADVVKKLPKEIVAALSEQFAGGSAAEEAGTEANSQTLKELLLDIIESAASDYAWDQEKIEEELNDQGDTSDWDAVVPNLAELVQEGKITVQEDGLWHSKMKVILTTEGNKLVPEEEEGKKKYEDLSDVEQEDISQQIAALVNEGQDALEIAATLHLKYNIITTPALENEINEVIAIKKEPAESPVKKKFTSLSQDEMKKIASFACGLKAASGYTMKQVLDSFANTYPDIDLDAMMESIITGIYEECPAPGKGVNFTPKKFLNLTGGELTGALETAKKYFHQGQGGLISGAVAKEFGIDDEDDPELKAWADKVWDQLQAEAKPGDKGYIAEYHPEDNVPDEKFYEAAMANLLGNGMTPDGVVKLFEGTIGNTKLKAAAKKLAKEETKEQITKGSVDFSNLPKWIQNKIKDVAHQMLVSGEKRDAVIAYISHNFNLTIDSVTKNIETIREQAIGEFAESIQAFKILGIGEQLAGCDVANGGLKTLQPGTLAYCQGVAKPSDVSLAGGQAPKAEILVDGKKVSHVTSTQNISFETDAGESLLTYLSPDGPDYKKRLDFLAEMLTGFRFICEPATDSKLKCRYKVPEDGDLTIMDQANIRKAALFLSSIDKVPFLSNKCIPVALEYAKNHSTAMSKTNKPWDINVYPESVLDWAQIVCSKVK